MNTENADSKVCRIMGIDPGTRNVGYGIIEVSGNRLTFIGGGTIVAKGNEMSERLVTIHERLQEAIHHYKPSVAAIETVFGGTNIKTAIAIGEGRGVAVLSAAELGLQVVGYEPAVVKRAVAGSGRAVKEQIQEMTRRLLALPEIPASDHEADALALAITHAYRRQAADTGLISINKKIPSRGRRRR